MQNIARRLFKIVLWSLPVLFLGAWVAVEYVLPYSPIKPFRQTPDSMNWLLPHGTQPEHYGLNVRPMQVRTRDSIDLRVWVVPAAPQNAPAVPTTLILLHGISGCKEQYLPFAQQLSARGIQAVMLDLRAHGQSGGEFCTFGFYEKYDVSAVVDSLLAQNPNQRIGILGNSLGGAIALQALAEDKRLQFGVIESTFHDLESVVAEYGEDLFGFKSLWLAHHILEKSARIARFDPFSVKPGEAARHITQPVFMAHGDRDEKIPMRFGRINFEQLASPEKIWYTVPGAGHRNIRNAGGAAYEAALFEFIRDVGF